MTTNEYGIIVTRRNGNDNEGHKCGGAEYLDVATFGYFMRGKAVFPLESSLQEEAKGLVKKAEEYLKVHSNIRKITLKCEYEIK
jgi:hypothetical protein